MQGKKERELDLMRSFIERECGIVLGKDKDYLISSRLASIQAEFGISTLEDLHYAINNQRDPGLKEQVIDAITTNETSWFRDKTPFLILNELLLPQFIKTIRDGECDRIRIWSAGCSTGQEPYSIAMTIDRYLDYNRIEDVTLDNFEIIATDISKKVLKKARTARYDDMSMSRGIAPSIISIYFKREENSWILDKRIKNMVKFRHFNLKNSFTMLGKFDIVLCRYVTIYFSRDLKTDIFTRMAKLLRTPGGTLFLGNSEVFTGHEKFYDRRLYKGNIFYMVKGFDL